MEYIEFNLNSIRPKTDPSSYKWHYPNQNRNINRMKNRKEINPVYELKSSSSQTEIREHNRLEANLKSRIETVAVAELLDSVTNLPFEDSLGTFEETIQLYSNAHFRATIFKQSLVKGLIQVLLRAFRNVLRTTQLWHRHFEPLGFLLRNCCSGPVEFSATKIK